jgi:hypothetical protein
MQCLLLVFHLINQKQYDAYNNSDISIAKFGTDVISLENNTTSNIPIIPFTHYTGLRGLNEIATIENGNIKLLLAGWYRFWICSSLNISTNTVCALWMILGNYARSYALYSLSGWTVFSSFIYDEYYSDTTILNSISLQLAAKNTNITISDNNFVIFVERFAS